MQNSSKPQMPQSMVLITVAASDIGLETIQCYLNEGWRVVAQCRQKTPELEAIMTSTQNLGLIIQADFSDPQTTDRLLADYPLLSEVDAIIHLASLRESTPFVDIDADQMLRHLTVNVLPAYLLMRTLGPHMVKRGFGRFVHGSSIGVVFGGGSTSFSYSLSKHALEFIPAMSVKWSASNVFTNVVRIGVTDTRGFHADKSSAEISQRVALIPAKRMAQPIEIAQCLFQLGSEANTYMSGQIINMAGGE